MRKLTDRKTLRSIDWWLVANIFALVLYGLVSIAAAMATAAKRRRWPINWPI